ncbi:MAG: nuclear transport factor 2 family protein [Cyclobacteriaceae bacterium]|nr:nuclear transport factor 2 family protein [Cyclobacteriaceae bacterium]
MKLFLSLFICVFLGVSCAAQQTELEQLKEINARFIHNFVTNDVVSHAKLIHPGFICITSQGAWVGREEYLKAWVNGFDPEVIVYWDYRDEKITIIGNTALVRSVNKYTIIKNGEEITGMSQYTDTYVKEDGNWKCIQAQITPVATANYPPDQTIVKKYVKGKRM